MSGVKIVEGLREAVAHTRGDDGIFHQTHVTLSVERLRETIDLLRECADEIEGWVNHASERDMEIVERARKQADVLEEHKP
jgi:hypothetical protein